MDADRTAITWEHWYKKIYIKENWIFWNLVDFENITTYGSVKLKKECPLSEDQIARYPKEYLFWKKHKALFELSGDCDFGIKDYEQYTLKQHMFPNFSLLPKTGGLNNKKGSWINRSYAPSFHDRFDLFIYHLDQFYLSGNETEKKYYAKKYFWCNPQHRESTLECLYDFLNLFNDVYDYCKKMYFIDETIVFMLIKNGKEKVENEQNFCLLASLYWESRKKYLEQYLDKEEYAEWIDKDIDSANM